MARIRSIHPALFTDEAFAGLSMPARVLLFGLWTEADDQGVFDWKPITLKMRLMPADNVDVPAILAELERADVIRRFHQDGKTFGAVRNFCRFQKPKTPKYRAINSAEIRTYVASTYPIPEIPAADHCSFPQDEEMPHAEPSSFPKTGEMPAQREEGGGKRKREMDSPLRGGEARPREGISLSSDFQASADCRKKIAAMGFSERQFNSEFSKFIAYYMARGTKRADWESTLISWFQRASPESAASASTSGELSIEQAVQVFAKTGHWSRHAPVSDVSQVPAKLLAKHGLGPDGRKLPPAAPQAP